MVPRVRTVRAVALTINTKSSIWSPSRSWPVAAATSTVFPNHHRKESLPRARTGSYARLVLSVSGADPNRHPAPDCSVQLQCTAPHRAALVPGWAAVVLRQAYLFISWHQSTLPAGRGHVPPRRGPRRGEHCLTTNVLLGPLPSPWTAGPRPCVRVPGGGSISFSTKPAQAHDVPKTRPPARREHPLAICLGGYLGPAVVTAPAVIPGPGPAHIRPEARKCVWNEAQRTATLFGSIN